MVRTVVEGGGGSVIVSHMGGSKYFSRGTFVVELIFSQELGGAEASWGVCIGQGVTSVTLGELMRAAEGVESSPTDESSLTRLYLSR